MSIITQVVLLVVFLAVAQSQQQEACAACNGSNIGPRQCVRNALDLCQQFPTLSYCAVCGDTTLAAPALSCLEAIVSNHEQFCQSTNTPTQAPTNTPTQVPTNTPTQVPTPPVCIVQPPTVCQVTELIQLLEVGLNTNPGLAAQLLRISFHDAGTFANGEGGANGCLLTDPAFLSAPENGGLATPIFTLQTIFNQWKSTLSPCTTASAADVIQFAGLFAVVNQLALADFVAFEHSLFDFEWGRVDETVCNVDWTQNLPGFSHEGIGSGDIEGRLADSGLEINRKMIQGNGFTARQATALIGAHTIGQTRTSFGAALAGPWVENGNDEAPVFDNSFFLFLRDVNREHSGDISSFTPDNIDPFAVRFGDWFRTDSGLNWLDTDLALAFRPLGNYPNFLRHSLQFAESNDIFLTEFISALGVMSRLGVTQTSLQLAGNCDGAGQPILTATSTASTDQAVLVGSSTQSFDSGVVAPDITTAVAQGEPLDLLVAEANAQRLVAQVESDPSADPAAISTLATLGSL